MNQPEPPRPIARAASALTLVLLVAILVIAARSQPPVTSSRTGRRVQLVELIRAEEARSGELEQRVAQLSARVAAFEEASSSGAGEVKRLQSQINELSAPAGMTEVRGPGVVATLTDSSLSGSPTGNLNDLVIHEQDLQAVINALWAGGAEAISVNGQRVLATSAIRCVGNTLLLHGGVYSPPYVVRAIGDTVALHAALGRDPVVQRFEAAAQRYELGYDVAVDRDLRLPPYAGSPSLAVAQAVDSRRR